MASRGVMSEATPAKTTEKRAKKVARRGTMTMEVFMIADDVSRDVLMVVLLESLKNLIKKIG
jgi:hypothetical protein